MCREGQYSEQNSTITCRKCDTGRFLEEEDNKKEDHDHKEDCLECPPGKFGDTIGSTTCKICKEGQYTEEIGSKLCKKCREGSFLKDNGLTLEFHIDSLNCSDCPIKTYNPSKGVAICTDCPTSTQPGKTDCIPPKTSSDCTGAQYLNNTDLDLSKHFCQPCPLGAVCQNPETLKYKDQGVVWSKVIAEKGWWRLEAAEDRSRPPGCLSDPEIQGTQGVVQPTCAFEKCLEPAACQGADIDDPTRDSDLPEQCSNTSGYSNVCKDDEGKPIRCRLCGTCKGSKLGDVVGAFKRKGGVTRCQKCPPPSENRLLLGVGFLVMSIGCTIMVYMEITSETSDDETSDAVKKIIVSTI